MQRDRETETYIDLVRQTDRQIVRWIERQTDRQTDRNRQRQIETVI